MTPRKTYLASLLLFVIGSWLTQTAHAQRLYDKDKDAKAQAAQKQAEQIKSGALFKNQLKNLDTLTQQDIETYFIDAKRSARTHIGAFTTWREIDTLVKGIENALASLDQPRDCPGEDPLSVGSTGGETGGSLSATEAEVGQARKTLEKQIAETQAAAKKLQDKAAKTNDGALATMFAHVGDLKPVLDLAEKLLSSKDPNAANSTAPAGAASGATTPDKSRLEGAKQVVGVLGDLAKLYNDFNDKVEAIRKEVGKIEQLSVILQKIAMQSLQVREEHLKILGAIYARRETEEGEIKQLVRQYRIRFKRLTEDSVDPLHPEKTFTAYYKLIDAKASALPPGDPTSVGCPNLNRRDLEQPPKDLRDYVCREKIDDTIRKLIIYHKQAAPGDPNQQMLEDILGGLFSATALATRGNTPKELAVLRFGIECQRYSIRKSAVKARAYELAVSAGVDRLALFYSGGIKPSQVAQIFHNLATPFAIIFK